MLILESRPGLLSEGIGENASHRVSVEFVPLDWLRGVTDSEYVERLLPKSFLLLLKELTIITEVKSSKGMVIVRTRPFEMRLQRSW